MHHSTIRHARHNHDHHPCRHGACIDQDTVSVTTFLVLGAIIIAFSMLLAIIITTIRDYRGKHSATHEAEEELLRGEEDDEMLPPYEPAPPAYVAELSSGAEEIFPNRKQDLIDIKAVLLDEVV